MEEHTWKLWSLPQWTRKLMGMGKPQKKILKGADTRDGGAGKILRVLGGQVRRAGRIQRKTCRWVGGIMPFKGKSVVASPTPGAAGFSLFSHRPPCTSCEKSLAGALVCLWSTKLWLRLGGLCVCPRFLDTGGVSLLCWIVPREKHCATFLTKL